MRHAVLAVSMVLMVVTLPMVSGLVAAQSVADPKIATLDMLRVERDALAFQDLLAKYNAANAAFDESARSSDGQLRAEAQELQQQRAVLSSEAFNQRVAEFKERERQLNEEFSSRKTSIERARLAAAEQVKSVMRQILVSLSSEYGVNLVLNSSNLNQGLGSVIMLSSDEIDITGQVVEALNAQIQSVTFQLQ